MRGAIVAHQTRAIEGKHNIELFKRHVNNGLIDCSLEKGGIQSYYWFTAA